MEKPSLDAWIIGLARDIFVSRMVNSTNPEPAKNAITLAEDLTQHLVERGYTPYAVAADGAARRAA